MSRSIVIFVIIIVAAGFVISYFVFFLFPDFKELSNQREGKSPFASSLLLAIQQLFKQKEETTQTEEEPPLSSPSEIQKSTPPLSGPSTTEPSLDPSLFAKSEGLELEPEKPTIKINTYIVAGPKEEEVINETNRVTFEFEAKVSPEDTEGQITFQTKVEGLDEDWQESYSNHRTINFPSGPKEYTFLVRAKINDVIDQTPAKRTFKINTSPYFGKVKISNIQVPTSWNPDTLITLRAGLGEGEVVNITGWQIKGSKGSFTIPQGVEKYHPSYLLLDKSQIKSEDILVKRYDWIYLSSATNPLGDTNFKPNKCFGYLTNYYNFPISISKNCPKPSRYDEQFISELSHLGLACQRYILNLGYCEIPKHWEVPGVATDSECIAYLNENFNYQGCFRNYSNDKDFLKDEWHIYMNRNFNIGVLDVIYLRDQNGLLVDKYLYGQINWRI